MRAPMQVLVIPYLIDRERPYYCILKRSDAYYWHFIAGGAEDMETPLEAAAREASEEIGAPLGANITPLKFMTYVPAECISHKHRQHWQQIPSFCQSITLPCTRRTTQSGCRASIPSIAG